MCRPSELKILSIIHSLYRIILHIVSYFARNNIQEQLDDQHTSQNTNTPLASKLVNLLCFFSSFAIFQYLELAYWFKRIDDDRILGNVIIE